MKQLFIKQNHTDNLNLFFLGYGQDGEIFKTLTNFGSTDIAIVYDYENDNFDASLYDDYEKIYLIAWSMGVMIAPKVLSKYDLLYKVISSCAINGTLEGIDKLYGIPMEMWNATISGLNERAILKFYRRMCFDADLYEEYLKYKPQRSIESLKKELLFIQEFSKIPLVEGFFYNEAFISLKDKIISPINQLSSYKKTATIIQKVECAHYNFELFANRVV